MNKLFIGLLIFPLWIIGQSPIMSVNTQNDIDYLQKNIPSILKGDTDLIKELPLNYIAGEWYVSFLGKLNGNNFLSDDEDVIIGKGIGSIRSVRIKLTELNKISELNMLSHLELAGKIRPFLDKVNYDTRADSVHMGLGLLQPYFGTDVLIGVQDWGFDYTSPMFYDTLLEHSRVLAAWDQWKQSGPHPVGFDYGAEYIGWEELSIAETDTINQYNHGTHATHVAGIAGGSGMGTNYRGIAYNANFLFSTIFVDEAAAIDSWYWMRDKSLEFNKNLVVNMSWGLYHFGTSDGLSLLSQAIEELTSEGVLFVSSAGNNGNVNFHFQREFNNDSIKSVVGFENYNQVATLWGQSIHGWGEIGKNFEVKIEIHPSSGDMINQTQYFSTTMNDYQEGYLTVNDDADTIWYNISAQEAHPQNQKPTIRFRVKNTNPSLKIILSVRADEGEIHFWNVVELTTNGGNWGRPFSAKGMGYIAGDHNYGIGEPTTANSCISVASHAAEYEISGMIVGGGRSSFSSIGPRNDGALKPEISAPGSNVISSINSFTTENVTPSSSVVFQGKTYYLAKMSGTSMASPAVTGVCALIWEANPYLTPLQIKDIILETARKDNHTGDISFDGDLKWGFGKVDAMAALRAATGVVGLNEFESKDVAWTIYPNPTDDLISVSGIEDIQEVQLIDISGKLSQLNPQQTTWSINNFSKGTYLVRIVAQNRVYQKKIIIH